MFRKLLLVLALAFPSSAYAQRPPLPSDPIKAIEGIWYAEDAAVELEIHDGVVTARNVKTSNAYINNMKIVDGTVIYRAKTFDPAYGAFGGECWTTGGEGPKLYPCKEGANLAWNVNDGKWFLRFTTSTLSFRHKADFAPYMWQYRK